MRQRKGPRVVGRRIRCILCGFASSGKVWAGDRFFAPTILQYWAVGGRQGFVVRPVVLGAKDQLEIVGTVAARLRRALEWLTHETWRSETEVAKLLAEQKQPQQVLLRPPVPVVVRPTIRTRASSAPPVRPPAALVEVAT